MKPWLAIAALVLLGLAAWQAQGWAGVALVGSTGLFLLLLQFHRAMTVLRRAAARPVGLVPSAVMLQARLRPGMTNQQLVALAGSLGEAITPGGPDAGTPAADGDLHYRWHDPGDARVEVRLRGGKVVDWRFSRPPEGGTGEPPAG